ncbi:DNA replication protein psf1 [Tulasnella sp. 419]|nr:DNA replication protein psf1 [Tulasnella sp. 418]KAG8970059.1 DNA replication protein psf1 [Tulasnella sp. 419]
MFGDQALQLMTEARRSTATNALQKYNDEVVRSVQREIRMLQDDLEAVMARNSSVLTPSQAVLCVSTFYHIAIRRNKRCLLAYHQHRIDQLKHLYWSYGCALPPILNDPELRSLLAPQEIDFLKEYNEAVMDYRSDFIDVVDVAGSIMTPPKDLDVVVEVLKECGTIYTESGTFDFKKGQRYCLRRANIEHLIVQGYLQPV